MVARKFGIRPTSWWMKAKAKHTIGHWLVLPAARRGTSAQELWRGTAELVAGFGVGNSGNQQALIGRSRLEQPLVLRVVESSKEPAGSEAACFACAQDRSVHVVHLKEAQIF